MIKASVEYKEMFARMWRKVREDAGASQGEAAKLLGVSKTTIQNWEDGISCPNQVKGFEYFAALNMQPLPYYLEILFPEEYEKINNRKCGNADYKSALYRVIDTLPDHACEELVYLFYGKHGSSPFGILDTITAYLHTPLSFRIGITQHILMSYQIACCKNNAINPESVQPDVSALRNFILKATHAVLNDLDSYSSLKDN